MHFIRSQLQSDSLAPAVTLIASFRDRMNNDEGSLKGLKSAIEDLLDLEAEPVRRSFTDNGPIPFFGRTHRLDGPLVSFIGSEGDPTTPTMVRGTFDPGIPGRITISRAIAVALKRASSDAEVEIAWAKVLEATFLEEMVHWLEHHAINTLDASLFSPRGDTGRKVVRRFFAPDAVEPGLPQIPGASVPLASDVVDSLKELIRSRRIIFDETRMRKELVGGHSEKSATPKLQRLVVALTEMTDEQIRISSVVRASSAGHHSTGRAIDIGNEEIANKLLPILSQRVNIDRLGVDELIFDAKIVGKRDRNFWNYDRGRKHDYNARTLDTHGDHIHIAVAA